MSNQLGKTLSWLTLVSLAEISFRLGHTYPGSICFKSGDWSALLFYSKQFLNLRVLWSMWMSLISIWMYLTWKYWLENSKNSNNHLGPLELGWVIKLRSWAWLSFYILTWWEYFWVLIRIQELIGKKGWILCHYGRFKASVHLIQYLIYLGYV